jgi:hypothetical protein
LPKAAKQAKPPRDYSSNPFKQSPLKRSKEIKKTGEFVLPGFGKLVKQKRKARIGFNPKTQKKDPHTRENDGQIPVGESCERCRFIGIKK